MFLASSRTTRRIWKDTKFAVRAEAVSTGLVDARGRGPVEGTSARRRLVQRVQEEGKEAGPRLRASVVESEYESATGERDIAENQRFLQSLGFVGGDVGIPKEQKKTRGAPQKTRAASSYSTVV